jgi:hypothetical protein
MASFRNDTICARRRFNPLAVCTVVCANAQPQPRRYRGKRRPRRYSRLKNPRPVVARISG